MRSHHFRITERITVLAFVFSFTFFCKPNSFNNTGDYESSSYRETKILQCLLEGNCIPKNVSTERSYQIPDSLVSGLYAWYPLDGNFMDMSGNARHGYFPGGVWPVTLGPSYTIGHSNLTNGSASFNGTNQLFASNFLPLCHEDFTIALWIYTNVVYNNRILGFQGSPGGNPGITVVLNPTGNPEFSAYWVASGYNSDGISVSSSSVVSANVWTHIVYVHNGTTRQGTIWVNGLSAGTTANFGSFAGCTTGNSPNQWYNGTPLNIGYAYANQYFTGRMDDIWFFKGRQLNVSDISTLMGLP
ncbi:LamG domain-containing protein [Leptospira noumeaensis]|uniref:LamG domain-containing protein n=1 Tax=Leptospira noumeaensis TaxID=2484964 RepID=A0A4V3JJ77_9LEPT|nr:LamG domain-containing protein [Leptospira noumeaensis]TGK79060.1 LamG domain-containing protein [Leptospira noumeaensis]